MKEIYGCHEIEISSEKNQAGLLEAAMSSPNFFER